MEANLILMSSFDVSIEVIFPSVSNATIGTLVFRDTVLDVKIMIIFWPPLGEKSISNKKHTVYFRRDGFCSNAISNRVFAQIVSHRIYTLDLLYSSLCIHGVPGKM